MRSQSNDGGVPVLYARLGKSLDLALATAVTVAVVIIAALIACALIRSYARKRNIRIRDMIKPG
jgi:hypothetical protein